LEVGIDCVDISRFTENILSKKNTINRVFTRNEIQYCEKKVNSALHYAVRFAGKEAVVKAFYCFGIKLHLNQIEILNKEEGIPFVNILNEKIVDFDIKISLSHSIETAIAVAIVNTKN